MIKERILQNKNPKNIYLNMCLSRNGVQENHLAHRIVAIAWIENPENKPQVNHKNGIKNDNRVENLEWSTGSENIRHADLKGLRKMPKGEMSSGCKLTEKQVLEILEIGNSRYQKDIAKEYGVVQGMISFILNKKSWIHLHEK